MANVEAAVVEMEKELYFAAMRGTVEILQNQTDEYLLRKTRQNKNLIYIAIRYEQLQFIKASLAKFPNNYKLISDRESSNENTPLHIAAEVGNLDIMRVLYEYSVGVDVGEGGEKPWRLKNSKGNTPIHVALIHDNVKVAKFLLEEDHGFARILNQSNEAPLHIAMKQHVNYFESESMMARIKDPINKGGAGLAFKHETGEDMSSMITLLVEKASIVASWPDTKGMTPLLRAASLSTPYNSRMTKLLILHCPQSAEVCDATGMSILHLLVNKLPTYQDVRSLVSWREIFALRNHQDNKGNTPLHIAAKNKDINMVRVLLESSTKLNINNVDGICGASLIQQHNVFQMLRQRKMTKEESLSAEKANITFLREKMRNWGLDFVLSKDSTGKNILNKLMHIKNESRIIHDEFVGFIKEILEIFSSLVSQTDQNGNTPVHILMQNNFDTKIYIDSQNSISNQQTNNNAGNTITNDFVLSSFCQSKLSMELLEICKTCIDNNQKEAIKYEDVYDLPWVVKNANGNTPLHEAVIAKNKVLVLKLLEHNIKAASLVNKHEETPLHLIARHNNGDMDEFKRVDIQKMVAANKEAARLPDKDHLTPLLRAFKAGNHPTAVILCDLSPEAAGICDADDKTFWHLLMKHPSNYFVHLLLKNEALREALKLWDKEGNTPLHLAIMDNRFDIVQAFLEIWDNKEKKSERKWLVDLLNIPNKAGKTPADLIAEETCLPAKVEKSIKNKHELVGVRSVWGIPTTQTKTYVNSMGVIAALLATITFTAAFTVPGGLFEDIGTPVMLQKATFQVFMISDVVALCLSMMVLVCLLKIMATNNKRNSVVILDFSINLLLAAFYATIVTFMMGIFAAMFTVKPWIAIVTIVLCSLLILLVLKFLIIKLLNPFKRSTLYINWMLGKKMIKIFKIRNQVDGRGQGSSNIRDPERN